MTQGHMSSHACHLHERIPSLSGVNAEGSGAVGNPGWGTAHSLCRATTYIGVAIGTKDLFQERREAGEDTNATTKAYGQDNVGLILYELEGKTALTSGALAGFPGPRIHTTYQFEPVEETL